ARQAPPLSPCPWRRQIAQRHRLHLIVEDIVHRDTQRNETLALPGHAVFEGDDALDRRRDFVENFAQARRDAPLFGAQVVLSNFVNAAPK
ncbi:MAG: hypothetical protein ACR2FI_01870, partial [Burkholderiales bacterium]